MRDLYIMKIGAKARAYEFAKKIQPIYELLEWEWVGAEDGIPSVEEIYEETKRLIEDLDIDSDYISCGGITIRKEYDEDQCVGLQIAMEIEDTIYLSELI